MQELLLHFLTECSHIAMPARALAAAAQAAAAALTPWMLCPQLTRSLISHKVKAI